MSAWDCLCVLSSLLILTIKSECCFFLSLFLLAAAARKVPLITLLWVSQLFIGEVSSGLFSWKKCCMVDSTSVVTEGSVSREGSSFQVRERGVISGKCNDREMGWWSDIVMVSMDVRLIRGRSFCVRSR